MTDPRSRRLPDNPSLEFLRKEAKRLARTSSIRLAAGQRELARQYGFAGWAELVRHVGGLAPAPADLPPLVAAARTGDAERVRALIAAGNPVDARSPDGSTALWHACMSEAEDERRLATARALLEAGADTEAYGPNGPPLHAAAARGPLALVELLIRHGALEWRTDPKGRSAAAAARRGTARDRAGIAELLKRPVIRDPSFRRAVAAIRRGDAEALGRLLDGEPKLLRERIVEPDCYRDAGRHQYFLDPKLFWFVANNPNWTKRMPPNMVEAAEAMIARGVERDDLDYALELVMTSASARIEGLQIPLMRTILAAGGRASAKAIAVALAHRELETVRTLLALGQPVTAPIAAAFGHSGQLRGLLAGASSEERQAALAMAVMNARPSAVAAALEAGADPNAFMTVHAHSTPLHQAALNEDLESMELLVAHGARTDLRDRIWKGTPLDWAVHEGKERAREWLARHE